MAHSIKPRIMYIECKGDSLTGPTRIGRVTFNKRVIPCLMTENGSTVPKASNPIMFAKKPGRATGSQGLKNVVGMHCTRQT